MTSTQFNEKAGTLRNTLKLYALKLTKNQDDADDLLQETLMKAFRNKDKFQDGTNLQAWMYTILRNTFITNYQRMVRRNTFIDTTQNSHFLNSGGVLVENQATGSFVLNDINSAINSLKEMYKTPFNLYFSGYKYHEIAERLSIPIGTVKNRIHIARQELKEMLNTYASSN